MGDRALLLGEGLGREVDVGVLGAGGAERRDAQGEVRRADRARPALGVVEVADRVDVPEDQRLELARLERLADLGGRAAGRDLAACRGRTSRRSRPRGDRGRWRERGHLAAGRPPPCRRCRGRRRGRAAPGRRRGRSRRPSIRSLQTTTTGPASRSAAAKPFSSSPWAIAVRSSAQEAGGPAGRVAPRLEAAARADRGAAVECGRALGGDEQLGAVAAHGLADPQLEDRHLVHRVAADDEDRAGVVDVGHRDAPARAGRGRRGARAAGTARRVLVTSVEASGPRTIRWTR